jgi:hypothetical protein
MVTLLTGKTPYEECPTPVQLAQKLCAYQPPDAVQLIRDDMAADVVKGCFVGPQKRETAVGLLKHRYFEERPEAEEGVRFAETQPDEGRFVILRPISTAASTPKLPSKGIFLQGPSSAESPGLHFPP